jgi:dTDP-4-dehydrorhamnose reductase
MTVLIIGGCGFLGTELVRQAAAAGHATAAT